MNLSVVMKYRDVFFPSRKERDTKDNSELPQGIDLRPRNFAL